VRYIDIEAFIAYFQICPYILLNGLKRATKHIGISGSTRTMVLTKYLPNKMQIQLTCLIASKNLTGTPH
jgi:hypothetical protein